jgi:hypothetical protein
MRGLWLLGCVAGLGACEAVPSAGGALPPLVAPAVVADEGASPSVEPADAPQGEPDEAPPSDLPEASDDLAPPGADGSPEGGEPVDAPPPPDVSAGPTGEGLEAAVPDDADAADIFDGAGAGDATSSDALRLGSVARAAAEAPASGRPPLFEGAPARLVATVPTAQPPRAILALWTGEEIVVEPGSWVEPARLLVLGVGRDAVDVAQVTPRGDRAVLSMHTLTAAWKAGDDEPPSPRIQDVP